MSLALFKLCCSVSLQSRPVYIAVIFELGNLSTAYISFDYIRSFFELIVDLVTMVACGHVARHSLHRSAVSSHTRIIVQIVYPALPVLSSSE